MRSDKTRKSVMDRAIETFDLPGEVMSGMPKLTVTGDRRLHIESHRGLLEYDPGLIIVNGGAVIVTVRGAGMDVCAMSSEEILITGRIHGIDFD